MKIVFMGTPDFALPPLQALIDAGHEICAVFTQPDKPQGRKQILTAPPVKVLAQEYGIPVYQPNTLKNGKSDDIIRSYEPDFIVVVAYGKILPKAVLEMPKKACVNVHGSLLPKYRGAAPIQWSVINGDEYAGVTTMLMSEGMDEGDILLMLKTPVGEEETGGELFDRLSDMGASLLLETLETFDNIVPIPQNSEEATVAPILNKDMAEIDFINKTAKENNSFIRGMNPWPVAWFTFEGKRMKVFETEISDKNGEAGKVFAHGGEMYVYCKEGALKFVTIQPENKKQMNGSDYLRGHKIGEDK